MNLFAAVAAAACDNLGLIINTEKTVVIHQPPPDAAYDAPQINVNSAELQVVDNFTYLDSTLSRNTKNDAEVVYQISKAGEAFVRLRNQTRCAQSGHPADAAIFKLRWQDRIPDTDVLGRMGILSIYTMRRQLQLRLCGHPVRMDNERLLKRLFYADVTTGSRRQGGQVWVYKDTLKTPLRRLQTNPAN
nr:unnamed protein product [Spirometra erinaceieuropaei]